MSLIGPTFFNPDPDVNDENASAPAVQFGGNLYVAGFDINTAAIGVFKSADNGVSWTFLPGPSATGFWLGGNVNAFTVGNTFWFTYPDISTSEQSLTTFDIPTETFGSVIGGGPILPGLGASALAFSVFGSTAYLFYSPGGNDQLFQLTYSAGWGSAVLLDTVAGGNIVPAQAFVDATGQPACFYEVGFPSGLVQAKWAAIGITLLWEDTGLPADENISVYVTGVYDQANTQFLIGFTFFTPSGVSPLPPANVNILVIPQASPSSATWAAVGNLSGSVFPFLTGIAFQGSTVVVLVGVFAYPPVGAPPYQGQVLQFVGSYPSLSAWVGPTLFWDTTTNPFVPLHYFFGGAGPSGAPPGSMSLAIFGSTVTLVGGFASSDNSHAYFVSNTLVSAPLALACPIGNTATVGVPYTGMLLASGGTPPYTYEIIA